MQPRNRVGRIVAVLAILAGLAAMMGTASSTSASETTVTIHKAACLTTAKNLFNECHDNRVSGIGFTIGGRSLVTNGSGVTGSAVTAGTVTIAEGDAYLSDGGQYIYCSNTDTGRVLYDKGQKDGEISIKIKAGEHVVCDWYNLVKPKPQGVTITIHAFRCPANTKGDLFTACHKTSKADVGTFFFAFTGNHGAQDDANSKGTAVLNLATDTTGKASIQLEEDLDAITQKGAFVFCSSTGHPGSGNILGGKTVYNGVVHIKLQDGTSVTCDWYNLTP